MKLLTLKKGFTFASFIFIICTSGCHTTPRLTGPALTYVVEVSQSDLLRKFSGFSNDEAYNKAIDMAKQAEAAGSQDDFITLFEQSYNTIAPDGKLAEIFRYVPKFQQKLNATSTNQQIIAALRDADDEAIKAIATIIEQRFTRKPERVGSKFMVWLVDNFFKEEPTSRITVTQGKNPALLTVKVIGCEHPEGLANALFSVGRLEFYDTYENEEIYPVLANINKILAKEIGQKLFDNYTVLNINAGTNDAGAPKEDKNFFEGAVVDSTGSNKKVKLEPQAQKSGQKNFMESKDSTLLHDPLFRILNPVADPQGSLRQGATVGMSFGKDTGKVNGFLAMDAVRKVLPRDLRLLWSAKPLNYEKDVYELYAIKCNPATGAAPLDGSMIVDARAGFSSVQTPDITLKMSAAGTAIWARMTEEAANSICNGHDIHRCVAICLDDRVLSCPRVLGVISGGYTEITGISDQYESEIMARKLRGGAFPASVLIVEERIDSIR